MEKNNERLDFILDSFYKLEPKHRTSVIIGSSVALLGTFVLIFVFYFAQTNALESSLNNHTTYLGEIKKLLMQKKSQTLSSKTWSNKSKRKLQGFSIKPFLESAASGSQIRVSIDDVRDASDPEDIGKLSKVLKEKFVEISVQKVSLNRLLKFIERIEKPKKFVKIVAMKITSSDKLYFNLELTLRAFQTS